MKSIIYSCVTVLMIFQLQLWDTGGMERVASITSSYYKFAEAAVLVFALDNAASFHVLAQHLLDIVTYAENAKIFLCGNKSDLEGSIPQVTDADMESFWWVVGGYGCIHFLRIICWLGFAVNNVTI